VDFPNLPDEEEFDRVLDEIGAEIDRRLSGGPLLVDAGLRDAQHVDRILKRSGRHRGDQDVVLIRLAVGAEEAVRRKRDLPEERVRELHEKWQTRPISGEIVLPTEGIPSLAVARRFGVILAERLQSHPPGVLLGTPWYLKRDTSPLVRSTACAVFRNGRLLVLRRSKEMELHPGQWDMPGGFVEKGEAYRDGALRELREETGFRGGATRLFRRHVFRNPLRPWQLVSEQDYLIQFSSRSRVELDPTEHTEFRWISALEVKRLPTWDRKRETIRRAFEARRVHD
jgi:8-oxo-dGTP diphosphatase